MEKTQDTVQEKDATVQENVDEMQDTVQVTTEKPMQATKEIMMLQAISGEMTRQEIQTVLGLKHYGHFRTKYLLPAIQAGLIEMTIPEHPRNRNQRYSLTEKGREFLKSTRKEC